MPDLKLQIPNPCHENWYTMLPDERGRFCQRCNKVVVDFTIMSDVALKSYLNEQDKPFCGRLTRSQLKQYSVAGVTYGLSPVKILLTTGLAVSALSASAQQTNSHNQHNTPLQQTSLPATSITNQPEPDTTLVYNIKGQVLSGDEHNTPLPGVSVILKGTNKGAVTDTEGHFNLTLQEGVNTAIVLQFLYIGFDTTERTLSLQQSQTIELGKVYLSLNDQVLIGEVVIVRSNPVSRLWWKLKGVCTKVF